MVNNGFGSFKRPKKARKSHILNFLTNKLDDRERRQMNLTDHVKVPTSFYRLKTKFKLFGLLRPRYATIAKFQWFSKAPSPLNGMVWDNHWVQWFFNGFGVTQPLVSMVYDGCPPLVQRWNGYIPSLMSTLDQRTSSSLNTLRDRRKSKCFPGKIWMQRGISAIYIDHFQSAMFG